MPRLSIGTEPAMTLVPRIEVTIRQGTSADVPFIDALQKKHRNQVGFMRRQQLEEYVEGGFVLVAESSPSCHSRAPGCGNPAVEELDARLRGHDGAQPLGYCIAKDRYFKRDDVGVIFQLNVEPGSQRSLIGAALVNAAFQRAAYGCKLFCCWCAQDIEANYFWESVGFVPLAFRAGSEKRSRVHIFWEKRIREGDESTPYWYPSQTNAGAIREDRLVLPIPPGTQWKDAKPIVLPGVAKGSSADSGPVREGGRGRLPGGAPVRPRESRREKIDASLSPEERAARARAASRHLHGCPPGKLIVQIGTKTRFVDDPNYVPPKDLALAEVKQGRSEPKPARPKMKNDAKHVAMARELRDRYLEEVNSGAIELPCNGKYDVRRRLEAAPGRAEPIALLNAA